MSSSYSLKSLFKFSVVFVMLALIVVGLASLLFLTRAIDLSDEIVDDALVEYSQGVALQLALSRAAMPPNDYLIHQDQQEQVDFINLKEAVQKNFDLLLSLSTLISSQKLQIEKAHTEWLKARLLGDKIMLIQSPVANPVAAELMEQFDSHIDTAIDLVEVFNEHAQEEATLSHDLLHELRITASIFIITVFLAGVAMALIGGTVLSRAFFPSLQNLSNAMLRFRGGEFDYRITSQMPKEFNELGEGFNKMAQTLHELNTKLESESIHDSMTGVYNHRKFINDVYFETARSKRYRSMYTLFMIDVDHFKHINDTYGHPVGDTVLIALSNGINKVLRENDTLYRYGGEEFAVILTETSKPEGWAVAERLRRAVEEMTIQCNPEVEVSITISIGIGFYPNDAEDENDLIRRTDKALYKAKRHGRNQVCHDDEGCRP